MATVLIDRGRNHSVIQLATDAPPAVVQAAGELATHLFQIAQVHVPIERGPAAAGGAAPVAIHVGRSPAVERLLPGFDWSTLKEDGVVVREVGGELVLAGNSPRGALYAVYELLEQVLGCRWPARDCSYIPRRETVDVTGVNIVHTPPMRYREPFFSAAMDNAWAARNRANGSFYPLDEQWGGKIGYAGFVHTFYPMLPPEKHFAREPELYSQIDGKRVTERGQLCLTNPRVLELMVAAARQTLSDNPQARIVSISQNDWAGYCTCPGCAALDQAEGSHAGTLIHFVNAVAQQLEADFPHVLVDTLAYMYTVDPPRTVRPRKNVVVRLCHLNSPCDSHSLESCPNNAAYVQQLRGWTAIAPEVFIWDYFNNFAYYFMPYPNLDAICADLPFYARNGVTGLFCQGDGMPAKGSGDMAELRAWLCAQLMWRPRDNGWAIIDEFLRLYYGPAAEPIRAYLDLLHAPARKSPLHISPYMAPERTVPFLRDSVMKRAGGLFADAQAKAGSDEQLQERIARARLPLDYMGWKNDTHFVLRGNRFAPRSAKALARGRRFFVNAVLSGAEGSCESSARPIRDEILSLEGVAVVNLEAHGLRLAVAPALGGRMLGLWDPADGHNWMHLPLPDEPGFPVAGGYEEYSQVGYHSPGWAERYLVAEQTKDRLILTALLGPGHGHVAGLTLRRTYALKAGKTGPELHIESVLRNGGYGQGGALFRSHPEVNPGAWDDAEISFTNVAGQAQSWAPWRDEKTHHEHSQWLTGAALPAAAWSVRRGGRKLTVSWPAGAIEKALPSFHRRWGTLRLDLFGFPRTLAIGQSVVFHQTWALQDA